jgi:signal transduction histidine kinase
VHDVSDEDAHALGLPGGLLGPMLFVPFRAEGVAEGVLVVANVAGAAPFSELEVDLLKLFGSQITVALGFGTARAELEEMSLLEDRERIARDLHDTVIQRLFAVGMSLEGATRLIKFEPLENRVEEAVTQLDEIIRAIRLTIFTLEDRLGPDLGIRTEVMAVVAEAADQLGFSPDVDFEGPVDASIGPEVADQLLPCLREALSNVARHAGASRVEVRLRADEAVVLQVVDDGVGLGRTGRPDDPLAGGNGLRNMALRAERLGGSMGVESRPAGGTVIDWRVPLASAAGRSTASTGAPAGASSRSPEGG